MADAATPVEKASDELHAALEAADQAVEDAADAVVENVAEPVADATEAAEEAATAASDAIEGAVGEAISQAPELTDDHFERLYDRVMQRLTEGGHMTHEAATQVAGAAEPMTEEAEIATEAAHDTIAPRREHWWFRPRRVFGREL